MIHSFLRQMDFLYFGTQAKSIYRFGISLNKIFDYMMAERPIIQSVKTNSDLVKKAKCGFTALPENPRHLTKVIKQAISVSPDKLKLMAKRGKDYVLKYHEYNIIIKKFIRFLRCLR